MFDLESITSFSRKNITAISILSALTACEPRNHERIAHQRNITSEDQTKTSEEKIDISNYDQLSRIYKFSPLPRGLCLHMVESVKEKNIITATQCYILTNQDELGANILPYGPRIYVLIEKDENDNSKKESPQDFSALFKKAYY